MCRQLESAGCSYLTVHARYTHERHSPIHLEELKLVSECVNRMPIVANGDLFSFVDCERICEQTSVRGVMCARGLLENPALFAGYERTPDECVQDWIRIALGYGTPFQYFHSVLSHMLHNRLNKGERRYFNLLSSTSAVLNFLEETIFARTTIPTT